MSKVPVFLYAPNILSYARIVLAFVGLRHAPSSPRTAVTIWIVSAVLDFLDGVLARALNQSSAFGVLLDIFADNILRSCVWVAAAAADPFYLIPSCFVICLEWSTLVATQIHAAAHSKHWKHLRETDHWMIQAFFANNFRNPLGSLGLFGLFGANMFAYGSAHPSLYESVPFFFFWKCLAFFGRAIAMSIELWMCLGYFSAVLEQDNQIRKTRTKT
jgi:phosphatidylglycerophosphate synthase